MKTREADTMYAELDALIVGWRERGISEETILSRFHCVAVGAMQRAGVDFRSMVELVALHYGVARRRQTVVKL